MSSTQWKARFFVSDLYRSSRYAGGLRLGSFLLFVGITMAFSSSARSRADEETLRRFQSEAPIGWEKIVSSYVGKVFVSTEERIDRTTQPFDVVAFRANRESSVHNLGVHVRLDTASRSFDLNLEGIDPARATPRSIQNAPLESTPEKFTTVLNDAYFASVALIERPSISAVHRCETPEYRSNQRTIDRRRFPGLTLDRDQFLPDCLEGVSAVGGSTRSPTPFAYRVVDASKVDFNGQGMVQIELDYPSVGGPETTGVTATIALILDPERSWSVVRFQRQGLNSEVDSKFDTLVEVTYPEDDREGFHPVSRVETNQLSDSQAATMVTEKATFSRLRDSEYTQSDCSLSALGFPEPDFSQKNRWPILLASVALLAFALILLDRFGRRRRRSSSSTGAT